MLSLSLTTGPAVLGHSSRLAFSPDSAYLARAQHGTELGLSIFRTADWSVTYPAVPHTGVSLAYSPDGQYLAYNCERVYANQQCLFVLRTADWSLVPGLPFIGGEGSAVDWSPDGQYLAVAHEEGGDAPHLRVLRTADWSLVPGVPVIEWACDVAYSPDGRYLAVTDWNYRLHILRTADWHSVGVPSEPGYLWNPLYPLGGGIGWAPYGEYLSLPRWQVTAWGYAVEQVVLETATWGLVPGFPPVPGANRSTAFSPGAGYYLAVAHQKMTGMTIARTSDWATVPGTGGATEPGWWYVDEPGDGETLAWSPDGRLLALGIRGEPGLRIYALTGLLRPWRLHTLPLPVRPGARVASIELRLLLADARGVLQMTDAMLQAGRVPVLWNGHPSEQRF